MVIVELDKPRLILIVVAIVACLFLFPLLQGKVECYKYDEMIFACEDGRGGIGIKGVQSFRVSDSGSDHIRSDQIIDVSGFSGETVSILPVMWLLWLWLWLWRG
jgi:hypothetical protein